MGNAMGTQFSYPDRVGTMEEMNRMKTLEIAAQYEKKCSNFLLKSAVQIPVSEKAMKIYQDKFANVIGCEMGLLAKVVIEAFPWQTAAAVAGLGVAAVGAAVFIDVVMQEPDDMQKIKNAVMGCLTNVKNKELHAIVEAKIEELHTRVKHVSDEESVKKLFEIESATLTVLMTAKEFLSKDGTSWDMEEFNLFNVYRTAACVHLIAAELLHEKHELDAEGLGKSRASRYEELLELVPRYLAFRKSKIQLKEADRMQKMKEECIRGPEAKRCRIYDQLCDALTMRTLEFDPRTIEYDPASGFQKHAREQMKAYIDYLSKDAWTLAVAINASLVRGNLE